MKSSPNNKIHGTVIIVTIILLAAILRLYKLATIPVGFNDDEAAFGYNAYSILKTGKDEWSRFLPFPAFESFGDWKLAFYLYATIPSIATFGLNEFSTRLPSAIFGILSILTTFIVTSKLFNRKLALITAFLLSTSPWHIIASRNAFESDVLIFFITLATGLFLYGLKNTKLFILAMISFSISLYVYRSSWIFTPFFLSFLVFIFRREIIRRNLKYLIIVPILALPLLPAVLSFSGQSRFLQESFLTGISKSGIIDATNEKKGACQQEVNGILCRAIYNKYAAFTYTYANNYLKSLSYPNYFEKSTTTGYQSFSTRSVMYFFEFFLLLPGIYVFLKNKNYSTKTILVWIAIVPIGSSVAGYNNYGRINIIMPAIQIVTASGLLYFWKILNENGKKLLILILVPIIIFSVMKLQLDLFLAEPFDNSRYQRYVYKSLFMQLKSYDNNYDNFYISTNVDDAKQYIHYLFYNSIDPSYYFNNSKKGKNVDGWIVLESIGKYHFVQEDLDYNSLPPRSIVARQASQNTIKQAKAQIRDLRGEIIFEIVDVDEIKSFQAKNEL